MRGALIAIAATLLAGSAPATAAGSADPPLTRVHLKDGQVLDAVVVVSRGDASLEIAFPAGGRATLSADAISATEPLPPGAGAATSRLPGEPARDRYLFASSARLLSHGESYFSQTELLLSEGSIGIADHFSVTVGSAVPLLFAGADGLNLEGALKAGMALFPGIDAAVEARAFVVPYTRPLGFALAMVTLSNRIGEVTLSGGLGFNAAPGRMAAGDFTFVAAGRLVLGRNTSLVTEHWVLATQYELTILNALAVRWSSGRITADVGAMRMPVTKLPVPWLAIAYGL